MPTGDLRTTIHAVTAVESALLDLHGQFLGVPVAELLGDGQRTSVPMLGYLFFIGEHKRTDLPYLVEDAPSDRWEELRRQEAMTPAAAPGEVSALDTHWIWQDGQGLTRNPLQIKGGAVEVPDAPGLGIELDREALDKAHQLYLEHGLGARDDSIGMQYYIDGWSFDPKRPCLVR